MWLSTLGQGFPSTAIREEELITQKESGAGTEASSGCTNLHNKTRKKYNTHNTKNIYKPKNRNKQCVQNLPIFSANCAGCANKIQSLIDNVTHLDAGLITLQETHFKRKGKLNNKLVNFEVFEAIRKKQKGGTLIAAHKSLDPILIEEYSDDFELLVIEVKIGGRDVRVLSGYGPQENWKLKDKKPFFKALEEEIVKAKLSNKFIYIEMDANAKLGPTVIEGDPHNQSENGKLLHDIVIRHALIVMNNVKRKCTGKITRKRVTKKVNEQSIIDFVIVCDNMESIISEVLIDEERKHVLTRYTKTKKGPSIKESDHNSIVTHIKVSWNKNRNTKRTEMYNMKDIEGLKMFKEMTSNDNFLSEVFHDEEKKIEVKTKQFLKRLAFCVSKCFKKIRVKGTRRNKALEELFNQRRILRTKKDTHSIKNLQEVENKLSDLCAEDNLKLIREACGSISCEEGGMNSAKLWKLKKKLRRIITEPPTAMLDQHGNLVTTSKAIEDLTIEMYKERLKTLRIKSGLEVHQAQRENLCDERLKQAQENITPNWTSEDLDVVLKQLKNNKSRDPLGLANELFKPLNAGADLKNATLKLMNQIKQQQTVPDILKSCNITSLYKKKGSRKDFSNYRGIFRVTILRSILDKLIYNDEYPTIDENMTDSDVGARRHRNIRDNIFVINAILNNVRKPKIKGVDVTIYDVEKCFDKLWAKECFNDMFENGFQNDKLPLLFNENINANVAIKTSSGITKPIIISEVIMQGTVWGSLFCTSTIDKLGKQVYQMPEMCYNYKGVQIPPLGMVDDIISVTNVENTGRLNKMINMFIDSKKLGLSKDKCHRIHIGKGHDQCPELSVHDSKMKEADKEKYLGDIIDSSGNIEATIESRQKKGDGIISEILSLIDEIPLGKYKVEVALRLREAMLLNGVLFNSEAWHGVTAAQVAKLEKIDENLLRGILKAHRKTPSEFLYLETGTLPIRFIMAQRRINYLKHILSRNDEELIKKVYLAQKDNPTSGDFTKLLEKDLEMLGVNQEEVILNNFSKQKLKKAATNAAFSYLLNKKETHEKSKHIPYQSLTIHNYLVSDLLTHKEANMLTAIRSHCLRGIRYNFPKMFKDNLDCPLKCDELNPSPDTQEHLLYCKILNQTHCEENILMDHMYGDLLQQSKLSQKFCTLMSQREQLLEPQEDTS